MSFQAIPVIDLFAGPGGLGEGFSALCDAQRRRVFRIKLSIEKDEHAYRTLLLRAFFRQFRSAPEEYYDYLRGKLTREELFRRFPQAAAGAQEEAWHAT
ncbi:MAG: DNA cytosine methyltransferase, partial [Chthoniobacterales bacterium]|nr:DNA cytosine methyltransferase [Chthoniobacterales bacterium]